MGVFLAAENAMNQLWGVPFKSRPDASARVRARFCSCCSWAAGRSARRSSPVSGRSARISGPSRRSASLTLSTALNIGLFWVGFRVLTALDVSWRQLRGGAIAAGVLYELLQTLGGYYVGHTLKHAGDRLGTFGLVIGLLSWIYLAAHITLLAAEANVVATRQLWPRSFSLLIEQPATQADRARSRSRSRVEERRQDETDRRRRPHHRRGPHGCRPAAGDGLGRFISSLTSPAGGVLKVGRSRRSRAFRPLGRLLAQHLRVPRLQRRAFQKQVTAASLTNAGFPIRPPLGGRLDRASTRSVRCLPRSP